MRLFVAIEIAPEIRERIVAFIEKLRPTIAHGRWAREEGLHITLKFLGSVPDAKRFAIEDALHRVTAPAVPISVHHLGAFPNPKSPRVLWVGVASTPELPSLADRVDSAMFRLGFEQEKREFTPHVTLARFNDPRKANVSTALSAGELSFGTMTATEFHLYESQLSPKGSRYTKLATFALGKNPTGK